ncbi:paeninodin family lasso peptide [Virgibacillus necropolis]|nr:paeninodin family lasso peptide [Virgibacillus necropolis]
MKKTWSKPLLEVLDINMTMAGPGLHYPDEVQPDPDAMEDDVVHYS